MPGFQERWVVGKTIAAVSKSRQMDPYMGKCITKTESITFTDGSRLVMATTPLELGSACTPVYVPASRAKVRYIDASTQEVNDEKC